MCSKPHSIDCMKLRKMYKTKICGNQINEDFENYTFLSRFWEAPKFVRVSSWNLQKKMKYPNSHRQIDILKI